MNRIFSNTTFLTKKLLKEYITFWFINIILRIIKNKISLFILILLTILTLISIIPALNYFMIILSIMFIPLLLLILTYIIYPFIKNNKDHVDYIFDETYIKVNQNINCLSNNYTIEYDMLTSISETKNLYIIDLNSSVKNDIYVLLISKNSFSQGSANDFRQFLLSKINVAKI